VWLKSDFPSPIIDPITNFVMKREWKLHGSLFFSALNYSSIHTSANRSKKNTLLTAVFVFEEIGFIWVLLHSTSSKSEPLVCLKELGC
jgi:hypothetical protein